MLSTFDHSPASAQGALDLPELRPTLIQIFNAHNNTDGVNQTINSLDNDTLDIMDLLFEFIIEDKNIPLSMRCRLTHLQIPMLKVAIIDKTFFHQKTYPARRLLNNLAEAATGWDWSQTKNIEEAPLYQYINNIVANLVNEFETDIHVFDNINEELADFIAQQHNNDAIEKLTEEINQRQEKLESELRRFDTKTALEPGKMDEPIQRVEPRKYSSGEAIDKVKRLKTGTWLQIQEQDQEPRSIKFSWRSNHTKRCLFVTSKGIKTAEWSEEELAIMFEKGEALVLERSKPLMDPALISMMETVNK
jgi:hypothetical protein